MILDNFRIALFKASLIEIATELGHWLGMSI